MSGFVKTHEENAIVNYAPEATGQVFCRDKWYTRQVLTIEKAAPLNVWKKTSCNSNTGEVPIRVLIRQQISISYGSFYVIPRN
jgi:hypothetical protein